MQGSPERSRRAPLFDGFAFDPFSLFDDGFCSAEVGICRCDVFQALVIALVIVVLDERFDLCFQIAGEVIIFQQDAIFQGLVPAFDLTLGLMMERRTADMVHVLRRDIAGPIIAEQPRLVLDCCAPSVASAEN